MEKFFTLLAWIFGILSTGLFVIRIIAALTFSETDKMIDDYNGVSRSFPVLVPVIIMIVCWCWVLAC